MQNETRPLLLQASGVTKAFYGNTVLDHVDFDLAYGEVLGLVGQNGAGKSTLVKILTGVYQKDEGSIKIEGKEAVLDSIQSANASGISIVFQELSLALNMTVADNIFIGDYPTDSLSLIKKKELYKRTQDLLNRFNVDIRPTDIVGSLTSGKRQIVEIIKAISKNPKVLILDEPTSSLEEKEIQILFEFIRNLKANNFSIIYISHHMSEIFEIVDNLLILRDGKKVCACSKNDITTQELIALMIGQEYHGGSTTGQSRKIDGPTVLEVRNLSDGKHFQDVSFSIARGEVLGIAGIIGCGKTELCEAIYALRKTSSGQVLINGTPVNLRTPSDCKNHNLLLIPENRKTQGLFLNFSVKNNMITCILKKLSKFGFLQGKKINHIIDTYQDSLHIKMSSPNQIVRYLSGGNQQKVLIAKCIADNPQILIAMDPTRGIDVAAKADIHQIIHELSSQGLSILVISSELDEVMKMADRILVMNSGRIMNEYLRESFNEEEIMVAMHQTVHNSEENA